MKFKNFLSFERMITPVIIKVLFYIGLVVSVIGGIVVFIGSVIAGLRTEALDPSCLVNRRLDRRRPDRLPGCPGYPIYAELLILFFRINETLTDIKGYCRKSNFLSM